MNTRGDILTILTEQIASMGLRILPVTQSHVLMVGRLPNVDWVDEVGVNRRHADPFDRLIVAQAMVEALPILSADHHMGRYGVEGIW